MRAGLRRIVDLGCGIGGDAMAMAALGLEVTAVEIDEVTATVASYNLAPFENAGVVHAAAEDTDLTPFDALYVDPARRTAGHANTSRLTQYSDYTPSLDVVFAAAAAKPAGVKLGPGFDRDLIPDDAEAQWVSVDGQVVELGLWFGALARDGIRRSALVLDETGNHELHAGADSPDVEVGPLGDVPLGAGRRRDPGAPHRRRGTDARCPHAQRRHRLPHRERRGIQPVRQGIPRSRTLRPR